jgi:hypothetical protein
MDPEKYGSGPYIVEAVYKSNASVWFYHQDEATALACYKRGLKSDRILRVRMFVEEGYESPFPEKPRPSRCLLLPPIVPEEDYTVEINPRNLLY